MPHPLAAIVIFGLMGAIVGSFLAAVSVRLPRDESVVGGRSRCRACERPLAPWHLVPVLSWLALRGRCGWCGAAVSPRYLIIELAAAAIGVWAALHGSGWLMITATAILGWQLLLIAVVDAEHLWLPDALTVPLIATGLAFNAAITGGWPWSQMVGLAAGFGSLWLLGRLYRRLRGREGLGGGDPILFAGAGAWIGWTGLPSVVLLASGIGLGLVAARLMLRRPVAAADRLPFGSLLAAGLWLTWLYGPLGY
tara:strand:- start:38387 stop:39142 length:756 start_codon:yes stop_codon:yes gene_type:complete